MTAAPFVPPTARLNLLLAGVAAALAGRGFVLGLIVATAVGVVALLDRRSVLALVRPAFLVFAALAMVFGAALLGGGLAGGPIVGRGAVALVLGTWAGRGASPFELGRLAARFGVGWLGFAVGAALVALPELGGSARRSWDSLRLRGGLRRNRARNLRLLAAATLANALARADAQAEVAAARGFRLDLPPEPGPRWGWGVLALVLGADLGAAVVLGAAILG